MAVSQPQKLMRQQIKRSMVAVNDQVLGRDPKMIAYKHDKRRVMLDTLTCQRIKPLLTELKKNGLADRERVVAMRPSVQRRRGADPRTRRSQHEKRGLTRHRKARQPNLARDERDHAVGAVARRVDQGIVQSAHTTKPEDAVRQFGRQSSKPLVPPQNSLQDCLVHPSFLPRKNRKRLSFQRQFGSLKRTSHCSPVGEWSGYFR